MTNTSPSGTMLPNINPYYTVHRPAVAMTTGGVSRPFSTQNSRYQTIAPLSLNAIVTRQTKPITANTRITGRRVVL